MVHSKLVRSVAVAAVAAAVGAMALGGCQAKLNGNITINGAAFTPQTCRSGQPMGFAGVELADGAGQKIRIITDPAGSGGAIVVHMPAGAAVGMPVPGCGTVTVTPQNSTVNNVRNVEGRAQLQCATPGGVIAGNIEFGNCH